MKKSSKIKNEIQAKTTILEKQKTKIPLTFSKLIKNVIFENVLLPYKNQNAGNFPAKTRKKWVLFEYI